jgi:hypothetical protein
MIARFLTRSYCSVSADAAGLLAGLLPVDLEIEKANCLRELRNGRGAHFQNEHFGPDTFDSVPHASLYLMAEDKWQERFTNSEKGRITYEFLPTVITDPEQLPHLTWKRTQVLTGTENSAAIF